MNTTEQRFVLQWHCHELTLLRTLPIMLDNEMFTDITIIVGDNVVKAHKLVLAMCSSYFFHIFQEMGSTQNPVVVLHNINIEDLHAIISFIYKGQCTVTNSQLPNLIAAAKVLKIQGLCDMNVPEMKPTIKDNLKNDKINDLTANKYFNNNEQKSDLNFELIKKIKTELNNNESKLIEKIKDRKSERIDEELISHPTTSPTPILPTSKRDLSENCKCFLCGKYLSNQYNLRVHMETHNEAYHACQSCPHVSRSRDALRKHVSYRHPSDFHSKKRKRP